MGCLAWDPVPPFNIAALWTIPLGVIWASARVKMNNRTRTHTLSSIRLKVLSLPRCNLCYRSCPKVLRQALGSKKDARFWIPLCGSHQPNYHTPAMEVYTKLPALGVEVCTKLAHPRGGSVSLAPHSGVPATVRSAKHRGCLISAMDVYALEVRHRAWVFDDGPGCLILALDA